MEKKQYYEPPAVYMLAVTTEGHLLQMVVEYGILLSSLTQNGAFLGGDQLRIVKRVLVVHTIVA